MWPNFCCENQAFWLQRDEEEKLEEGRSKLVCVESDNWGAGVWVKATM